MKNLILSAFTALGVTLGVGALTAEAHFNRVGFNRVGFNGVGYSYGFHNTVQFINYSYVQQPTVSFAPVNYGYNPVGYSYNPVGLAPVGYSPCQQQIALPVPVAAPAPVGDPAPALPVAIAVPSYNYATVAFVGTNHYGIRQGLVGVTHVSEVRGVRIVRPKVVRQRTVRQRGRVIRRGRR